MTSMQKSMCVLIRGVGAMEVVECALGIVDPPSLSNGVDRRGCFFSHKVFFFTKKSILSRIFSTFFCFFLNLKPKN